MADMTNPALGRAVLDYVTAHPEEHDQRYFVGSRTRFGDVVGSVPHRNLCGTTACVAGHAMLRSGYTLRVGPRPFYDYSFVRPDGTTVEVPEIDGAELLGLDPDTAGALFYTMDNDMALEFLAELVTAAESEA